MVGNGERIHFLEDLWWGNQPLCSQFLGLYRVIYVKNFPVSVVLGNSYPLSWNFNFRCNLKLNSFKNSCPPLVQCIFLILWKIRLLTIKSFFLALSNFSNPVLFLLTKFLWRSKTHTKVKALAWVVAHGKVNNNDKVRLRIPYKSCCPQWCIPCKEMENQLTTFLYIAL